MNQLHPIQHSLTDTNLNTPPTLNLKEIKTLIRYLYYLKLKEKHNTVPDEELAAIAKSKAVKDTTANGLTGAIILLIEGLGGFASRQTSSGTYRADIGRLVKSNTKRGVSDVVGVLNGKPVNIEVKTGADKMSDYQKKVRNQIEAAGGLYYIAKDLQSTFTWLCSNYNISHQFIEEALKKSCKIFCKK